MSEQTKVPLWKQIVGSPKWWLGPGLAIVLVLALMVWTSDDAEGVAPTVTTSAADEQKEPTCGTFKVKCKAAKRVKQFGNHKLGNAKGTHFNKAFKKRVIRKMNARQMKDDDNWGWIKAPFKAATCLVANPYSATQATCAQGQGDINEMTKETSSFVFWCGGAAVIGSLRGGGYWGAGRGLASCMWTRYFMKAFG